PVFAQIDAIEQNAPACCVIKPCEQVHHRRLTGAGPPDNADRRPGRDVERDVVENTFGPVGKRDVLEADPPGSAPQWSSRRSLRYIRRAVEQSAGALGASDIGL